jgi:general secretion pathway protein C
MKPLFSPDMIKKVIGILILFLLVKTLWFAIELGFLPMQGVDHIKEKYAKPLYYRIKLTPNEAPAPTTAPRPKIPTSNIRDIVLFGIYNAPDQTVVMLKYKGKSKVIAKGEAINGFVLDRAGNTFAVFTKNSKEYTVTLQKPKNSDAINERITPTHHVKSPAETPIGEVVDVGDRKIIDRSLLDHYTSNMENIYKSIGIKEVKKEGKIEGFQVTFVKRDTPFAKLGLRRGDILKAVNGQELTSYQAAFSAYEGINDAQGLTLTIKRGNKEMELEYEIN